MEITVTQARPVILPGRRSKLALTGTGVGQRLVPGLNFVKDDVWQHAKDNPSVKLWLNAGILTVGKAALPPEELPADAIDDDPAGAAAPDTLRGLPHAACKAKILETADRALLTKWGDSENRRPVIELIEKRLAELS